ncbi:MAG: PaaX family transcriptional regulator C-terminal domain-containing protein [Halanaerobiales bacterium]
MASSNKREFSISQLMQLCSLFDINESQLRTNLSRMSEKGLLESKRKGRKAYYSFADKGDSLKQNISLSFRSLDWGNWDNKWWGVSFSLPDEKNTKRYYIRKKLSVYRFVSYNPGFWIRPLNRSENLEKKLNKVFSSKYCCVTKFEFYNEISKEEVSTLWNLEDINKDFKNALEIIKESRMKILKLSPEEAFKAKILTGNSIVNTLFRDPLLPKIYLPENWAAEKLKSQFDLWNEEINKISKEFLKNLD